MSVGGNDLISITFFDTDNKRKKVIDLMHTHKCMDIHTHHGYKYSENDSKKGAAKLTPEEKKMVYRVNKLWYNHINSK